MAHSQNVFGELVWRVFRFSGVLPCVALFFTGCASQSKPQPEALPFEAGGRASDNMLERSLARVTRGPLREDEIDTYFLFAEHCFQERKLEAAEVLFRAVFEARPTLTVGLKLSGVLIVNGRFDDAEKLVRKLAVLYPQSSEVQLALAQIYLAQGKQNSALKVLEASYRKENRNEEIAARYVDLLISMRKGTQARNILRDVSARPDAGPYFLLKYAQIKVEEKNYPQAKQLLERLFRVAPDSIEGWTLAGYMATQEQNFEAAERYFREAYTKQPENDTLARYYVAQLLRQNKYQEARRLLVRMEASPDGKKEVDPELTFQLGYVLFQLDEYAEARTRFQALLARPTTGETDPSEASKITFFLGQCEELLKNYDEAERVYARIPPTSELYRTAEQRIIFVTFEKGDLEGTRKLVAAYKPTPSEDESGYRFLAAIKSRLQDFNGAYAATQDGLKRFPKSVELAFLAASYREHLQSREAAVAAVETFLKQHPDYPQALNYLGYTLAEMGTRLDYALSLLKKAVEKEPKNGFYLDSLGWAYYRNKQMDKAEVYLTKALVVEPDEPLIYEHLGEVHYSRKDFAGALKLFEQAEKRFQVQPAWKVELDGEWKTSAARVKTRISELRGMSFQAGSESSQR